MKLVIKIPCDEYNAKELENEVVMMFVEWLGEDVYDVEFIIEE